VLHGDDCVQVQPFGLKLAQQKLTFIPSLNKMYGTKKLWSEEKGLPHDFPQISCQNFHTQNERGPKETEEILSNFFVPKTLPFTQNVCRLVKNGRKF
jgi:hypothetical protein